LSYTLKIIDDLKTNGITSGQFEFAKKSLINSAGFMYNTPGKRVENTLLERTLNLPAGLMKSHADQIASLKLDDVNSALRTFIQPDHLTIAVVGTAKDLKAPLAKAAGLSESAVDVRAYDAE
jgi:predicted Zn-dependent peptidase